MIHIVPAVVAMAQWQSAESDLRADLGRDPQPNEVRMRLGWPTVVGEADLPYYPGGAGSSVPISISCLPATRFRIQLTALARGGTQATILKVPD